MHEAIPITDAIHWIGVNDRETDLFEGIWPLPRGVSYNSYVITDGAVTVLDTVKRTAFAEYLAKLKRLIGEDRPVDNLIIHHLEPDHSGSIVLLREIFPDLQIIGNQRTAEFLEHLYGITENVRVVTDGEEVDLGSRSVQFFITPMVHWPETMMTWAADEGILFSGDAFGGFGTLEGGVFDDEVDVEYFDDEILRYFSNIVGKYSPVVQKAIGRLGDLDIQTIAPSHGPVWRSEPERILGHYDRWSRQEGEPGVVIAFASMYQNTTRMMEAVARGVAQEGCQAVRVHDVCRTHVSYVIRDIWRYRGLILAGPTYDTQLFPRMNYLIHLLREKRLTHRLVGCFGTYGWSGGGVSTLRKFIDEAKLDLVEPVVEARFCPKDPDLEQCEALGRNVVRAVRDAEGA
jgi:flavorubredoxin